MHCMRIAEAMVHLDEPGPQSGARSFRVRECLSLPAGLCGGRLAGVTIKPGSQQTTENL